MPKVVTEETDTSIKNSFNTPKPAPSAPAAASVSNKGASDRADKLINSYPSTYEELMKQKQQQADAMKRKNDNVDAPATTDKP